MTVVDDDYTDDSDYTPPDEVALLDEKAPPTKMRAHAFTGPIGEWVKRIAPHRESSPEALLITALVAFGSALGRTAYVTTSDRKQFGNIYAVLVGKTASGRKGSSWATVKHNLLDQIVSDVPLPHTVEGVGSGEVLIHLVRDSKLGTGNTPADPGVEDKRLLVREEEFSRLLVAMKRDGNTTSQMLRSFYDSGEAENTVKGNPAKATGAHVSMLGHITPKELRATLNVAEISNGFANRCIFVHSQRTRLLPFGGEVVLVDDIVEKLGRSLTACHAIGEHRLPFDDEAKRLWVQIYAQLNVELDDGSTAAEELLARGTNHILRVAVIYAAADISDCIRRRHLEAALAVWEYGKATALHIWGSASTNSMLANKMFAFAMDHYSEWVRQSWIGERFKNYSNQQRDDALSLLTRVGLLESRRQDTCGRPLTEYRAMGRRGKTHVWDRLFTPIDPGPTQPSGSGPKPGGASGEEGGSGGSVPEEAPRGGFSTFSPGDSGRAAKTGGGEKQVISTEKGVSIGIPYGLEALDLSESTPGASGSPKGQGKRGKRGQNRSNAPSAPPQSGMSAAEEVRS